jgi:Holliday junction DNA helicase RuvA
MIAFLKGRLAFKSPTTLLIDVNGVGYEVHISLHTYSALGNSEQVQLHTYLQVREDAHVLYGFFDVKEKELFLQLISVQGIGPNTARTILSYVSPDELKRAIIAADVASVQRIKGIGPKTAQRMIIELKDKLLKSHPENLDLGEMAYNNVREEALLALVTLGFPKAQMEKNINQLLAKADAPQNVEALIKQILRTV